MKEYLAVLGLKVQDPVSGFVGVVTSVSFDLYGCVQCIVRPRMDKDGKLPDACWFDHKRLTVMDPTPVMPVPTFDAPLKQEPGPEGKPSQRGNPLP